MKLWPVENAGRCVSTGSRAQAREADVSRRPEAPVTPPLPIPNRSLIGAEAPMSATYRASQLNFHLRMWLRGIFPRFTSIHPPAGGHSVTGFWFGARVPQGGIVSAVAIKKVGLEIFYRNGIF